MFSIVVGFIASLIIPGAFIGLFYYNITEWIGDKTCYVNQVDGIAYEIGTGGAGEVDVADVWKTYSLIGAILWGVICLGNFCKSMANCTALGGPETVALGIPMALGACCCGLIAGLGIIGFTIWGSTLRFGEVGKVASEIILKDSGLAFMIINIIHYVIVVGPLAICMFCFCCMICCATMAGGLR